MPSSTEPTVPLIPECPPPPHPHTHRVWSMAASEPQQGLPEAQGAWLSQGQLGFPAPSSGLAQVAGQGHSPVHLRSYPWLPCWLPLPLPPKQQSPAYAGLTPSCSRLPRGGWGPQACLSGSMDLGSGFTGKAVAEGGRGSPWQLLAVGTGWLVGTNSSRGPRGPGRPWPPQGSYPYPFSVAQRGKEALPNLASPVSPPPSGNVSPGLARDSASRPHPRALHPSCESMHQLPGWQAPSREPQGISRLEELSSRERCSQAAGGRVGNAQFQGETPAPAPYTRPRGQGEGGRSPTRIPVVKTRAKSSITSSFHPTQTRRAMGPPRAPWWV